MKIINPGSVNNLYYHVVGLVLLVLNKIRHTVQGYKNPRPFPTTEIQRAIDYDYQVVEEWTEQLSEYSKNTISLEGQSILELGPGADLGVGVILLAKGVKKYHALDRHSLVHSAPKQFYQELFQRLAETRDGLDVDALRTQLEMTLNGNNDRLDYVVRRDFDVMSFKGHDIDIVLSQAAFEHFDDIGQVFARLGSVVRRGAVLVATVDLQTHTRWIREVDPLNIYRYSDFVYKLFKFPGSPTRVTPSEYKTLLQNNGWQNVEIKPLIVLEDGYMARTQHTLSRRFRNRAGDMSILGMMICATKT